MNSENRVDSILANLKEQHSCYDRLLELLFAQQRAIAQDDVERLMDLIKEKNPLIQSINQLEKEARREVQHLSEEEHREFQNKGQPIKESIMNTLEQLIQEEEKSARSISDKRGELHDQIMEFKKKKNLFKGYDDPGSKGSRFSGNF